MKNRLLSLITGLAVVTSMSLTGVVFADDAQTTQKSNNNEVLVQILPDVENIIEFEDHVDNFNEIPNQICDDQTHPGNHASNNKYLGFDTDERTTPVTFVLPVEVIEGGYYELKYIASNAGSNTEMYIDDEIKPFYVSQKKNGKDLDRQYGGVQNGNFYPYLANWWQPAFEYNAQVKLPEGVHNIKLNFTVRGGSNKDVAICLDCLKFKKINSAVIEANVENVVEFENYAQCFSGASPALRNKSNKPNNHASGDGYLEIDTDVRTEPLSFILPINVLEDGLYDLKFIASSVGTNTSMYLDNEETPFYKAQGNQGRYLDGLYGGDFKYFEAQWHSAYEYSTPVMLKKGEHGIKFDFSLRGAPNSDVAICVDCIKLKQRESLKIVPDMENIIEFEDHTEDFSIMPNQICDTNTHPENHASGGKYISIDTDVRTEPVTFILPIEVIEDGFYDLQYIASFAGSETKMYLDGAPDAFFTAANKNGKSMDEQYGGGQADNFWPYLANWWQPAFEYNTTVMLSKGVHIIRFDLTLRGGSNQDVAICMDCLKLNKQKAYDILPDAENIIEFEECTEKFSEKPNEILNSENRPFNYASGGKYINIDTTHRTEPVEFIMQINVLEEGIYDFTYIASLVNEAEGSSYTEFSIDSEPFFYTTKGDNSAVDMDREVDSEGFIEETYYSPYFDGMYHRARKYSFSAKLMPGEHNLKLTLTPRTGSEDPDTNDVAINMDCLKIKKAEQKDLFSIENNNAHAVVYYQTPVSGMAVLALYDNNKLIGFTVKNVDNSDMVDIIMPCEVNTADARVMIINNLNDIYPLADVKIFNK